MNYLAKRSFYSLMIIVFIILTFVSIAYSMKVASDIKKYQPEINNQLESRLQTLCEQNIAEGGFTLSDSSPRTITATLSNALQDPTYSMTLSSAVIQSCPGYALEYFCMGPECNKSLEFTLGLQ